MLQLDNAQTNQHHKTNKIRNNKLLISVKIESLFNYKLHERLRKNHALSTDIIIIIQNNYFFYKVSTCSVTVKLKFLHKLVTKV